jgi:hypothetical protein
MKKATCSVAANLGILENKIYDSQLEINWLINEVPHIKDPASLYEAEQRIVEATNRLLVSCSLHWVSPLISTMQPST